MHCGVLELTDASVLIHRKELNLRVDCVNDGVEAEAKEEGFELRCLEVFLTHNAPNLFVKLEKEMISTSENLFISQHCLTALSHIHHSFIVRSQCNYDFWDPSSQKTFVVGHGKKRGCLQKLIYSHIASHFRTTADQLGIIVVFAAKLLAVSEVF